MTESKIERIIHVSTRVVKPGKYEDKIVSQGFEDDDVMYQEMLIRVVRSVIHKRNGKHAEITLKYE